MQNIKILTKTKESLRVTYPATKIVMFYNNSVIQYFNISGTFNSKPYPSPVLPLCHRDVLDIFWFQNPTTQPAKKRLLTFIKRFSRNHNQTRLCLLNVY